MEIKSKIIAVSFLLIGMMIGSNNFAKSDIATIKIAVVDVPTIVAKSAQVKALKDEQTKKSLELQKWLDSVNKEVKAQSTEANKEKLLKKYTEELKKKKEANAKDYAQKLSAIDKNLSDTIADQAKKRGYDVVLAKSTVLYGGDDLTEDIAKIIK